MAQFYSKNRCLQCIEATIEADQRVLILDVLTAVSQNPRLFGDLIIICYNRAPVAEGSEILCRIEAEAGGVA